MHRIEAIGAVVRRRTVGPLDAHAADGHVRRREDLQLIARAVLEGQVLDREAIGAHQQALAAAALVLERQDRLVLTLAADRHARHVERQLPVNFIKAGLQDDDVAFLRVDQDREDGLAIVRAGLEHDAASDRTAAALRRRPGRHRIAAARARSAGARSVRARSERDDEDETEPGLAAAERLDVRGR